MVRQIFFGRPRHEAGRSPWGLGMVLGALPPTPRQFFGTISAAF